MKRIATLAALAAIAVAWQMWPSRNAKPPEHSAPVSDQHKTASVSEPHALPVSPAPQPAQRTHKKSIQLSAELNAPQGDAAHDVFILHQILTQYQRALGSRQGSPIGNDTDLARALSGRNPMREAFITSDHPAMSANGHIIDRWGTPYHLHPRGFGAYEIRSAGPDRKLFTADDLVANGLPNGQ